jgi:hypothetical protein
MKATREFVVPKSMPTMRSVAIVVVFKIEAQQSEIGSEQLPATRTLFANC